MEAAMTLEEIRARMAAFVEERDWNQFHTPRNLLLALAGEVGELSEIFQWRGDHDDVNDKDRVHLGEELSDVLLYLVRLADKCDVDLPVALDDKIVKNAIKYPLQSGEIDETHLIKNTTTSRFEPTLTLEALRKRIAEFSDKRGWYHGHTPRNLVLALTGELGELCEIFQWKGEVLSVSDWPSDEKEHLGEELSDVAIYLIRLADKCNVDLPAAVNDKMVKNANKYPADMVRGSSKKYSEYKRNGASKQQQS